MCCPYKCPPHLCSSNESLEECDYDPCCSCSASRKPCPPPSCPSPCTPYPQRRPPRPCPPRCPPRPCSPFPPPCCPCKVKGKFGLAYIVETPKNRCETPLGWQIEFEDTPSKIASSCKKMMQWVNCPPLGECGTDAVMSGYPKKCATAFACNPKLCCYEDETPSPCDCDSEPKFCCLKPQKCCKPRPQRRSPCCCALPQQSCRCGKQESRKKYEEPGCCCKKRGNTLRDDDDSLDYVPDKEVRYKNRNGRENQKKEQKESKYVQHDQSHHVKDEETATGELRASSILSPQLVPSDLVLTPSKDGLYSAASLLREHCRKQEKSTTKNTHSENNVIRKSSSKQIAIQDLTSASENVLQNKNGMLGRNHSKDGNNQSMEESTGKSKSQIQSMEENIANCTCYLQSMKENMDESRSPNQSIEDNMANSRSPNQSMDNMPEARSDNQSMQENMPQYMSHNQSVEQNITISTSRNTGSPRHITQLESEINIPIEDYNALINEEPPNKKIPQMKYKTLREKIRQARKLQEEVIHHEEEKLHEIEETLKHGDNKQNDMQVDQQPEKQSSQIIHSIDTKTVGTSIHESVGQITSEKDMDTRSSKQVAETNGNDVVGVKILIEVKQSKKQIQQGSTMKHELEVIRRPSALT